MTRHDSGDRRIEWIAVGLATIVGVLVRIWMLGAQSLWIDEAFSVWVAEHSLVGLLQFVSSVDQHPPLYYLLLHVWIGLLGDSEASVRFLSALFGVATIPLFYLGGRILAGRIPALIAVLLLALSPFHIRYAQEARMYALMGFLAAALLYALAVYLGDSHPNTRRRRIALAGLVMCETALLYTHNSMVLTLPLALNAGVVAAWAIQRKRGVCGLPTLCEPSFLRHWLLAQAVVFLLWLPWLPAFVHQSRLVYQDFWIEALTGYGVWLVFHNFNLAFPEGWMALAPLWDIVYWTLAGLGLYALRKKNSIAILLGTLFLLPALTEIAISLRRPILIDRTLLWTTLPYYLLIASGIAWLLNGVRSYTRTGQESSETRLASVRSVAGFSALALLLGLSLYSLSAYYRQYQKEDWSALAAYMSQNVGSDDLVIINASWAQIPLDYYTSRPSDSGQAPRSVSGQVVGMPVTLFESGQLEPRMTNDDIAHLRETVTPYASVWLIYAHEWYTDPDYLIGTELARDYTLVDEQRFLGPRVLYFERSEPPD